MHNHESFFQWSDVEPLCVLRFLLKKAWMAVLAALIGAMSISIATFALFPLNYVSSATFVVNSRSVSPLYSTNITAASEVASVYSQMLRSDFVKDTLNEYLGRPVDSTITTEQLGETNLMKVSVTSSSPQDSFDMIKNIIDHQKELSGFASTSAVLTLLNNPTVVPAPSHSYNETTFSILFGVLCAAAMTAGLIWFSISRHTIQTSDGAKNNLDAKIIASVPHEKQPAPKTSPFYKGKRLRSNLNISSPAISFSFTEAIHRIAAKFEHEHTKGKIVFLFSSVSEAEGKSTLAANTALSLTEKAAKVLFIDLDLRRPVQNELLGLNVQKDHELGELLVSGVSASEILDAVIVDEHTGLSTLLSSKSYTDMIDLISSPILGQVIALARKRFDYVIIDSPPLGYFADSEQLSDLSDISVLVVRQDVVCAPEINDAIDALRAGKAEFLGCILNDMSHLSSHTSSYGYGYGRKYGKYSKYGKYGKYDSSPASPSK